MKPRLSTPCMTSFNPRARRGRDLGDPEVLIADKVSIHAPAGGATANGLHACVVVAVSIHAPAGGAT